MRDLLVRVVAEHGKSDTNCHGARPSLLESASIDWIRIAVCDAESARTSSSCCTPTS